MRIVAISDVHGKWNQLTIPECDILISAGDYSFKGERHMVKDFHAWLNAQEANHIISVQGNHETWVEKNFAEAKALALSVCPAVHFIDEGVIDIEGIKIFGSAITPWFCDWAWNRHRGPDIKRHWDRIPDDTQILITHGPPYGQLDIVYQADGVTPSSQGRVGCYQLEERIKDLKQLKLHVFGHIHGSAGEASFNGVKYINAAICDETYKPTNPVREFKL
jgi:Icc-related predicted phosphoesterase